MKYIKITKPGYGSYIQPFDELHQALDGELAGIETEITLVFEPINMTDEEYKNLPEFEGY